MSAHTPGPWESTDEPRSWPIIRDAKGRNIAKTDCSISAGEWIEDTEQAVANARLIAAAPDLLEALNRFDVDGLELEGDEEIDITMTAEDLRILRAAIAKAKGESP